MLYLLDWRWITQILTYLSAMLKVTVELHSGWSEWIVEDSLLRRVAKRDSAGVNKRRRLSDYRIACESQGQYISTMKFNRVYFLKRRCHTYVL